jgi:hypothetical protein
VLSAVREGEQTKRGEKGRKKERGGSLAERDAPGMCELFLSKMGCVEVQWGKFEFAEEVLQGCKGRNTPPSLRVDVLHREERGTERGTKEKGRMCECGCSDVTWRSNLLDGFHRVDH